MRWCYCGSCRCSGDIPATKQKELVGQVFGPALVISLRKESEPLYYNATWKEQGTSNRQVLLVVEGPIESFPYCTVSTGSSSTSLGPKNARPAMPTGRQRLRAPCSPSFFAVLHIQCSRITIVVAAHGISYATEAVARERAAADDQNTVQSLQMLAAAGRGLAAPTDVGSRNWVNAASLLSGVIPPVQPSTRKGVQSRRTANADVKGLGDLFVVVETGPQVAPLQPLFLQNHPSIILVCGKSFYAVVHDAGTYYSTAQYSPVLLLACAVLINTVNVCV